MSERVRPSDPHGPRSPLDRGDRGLARRTPVAVAVVVTTLAVGVVVGGWLSGDGTARRGNPTGAQAGSAGANVADLSEAAASAGRLHRYVSPKGSDRNNGARAHPWRTLGHAARTARAGMTVHVAPGSYQGELAIDRGGVQGRPVRFVSSRRWAARITTKAGDAPAHVVVITADHVTFEGFTVTGSGGDGSVGIEASGRYGLIRGNRVEHLSMPCVNSGNGGGGIVIGGSRLDYRTRDVVVDGNVVNDIGNGYLKGGCRVVHGIYAETPRATIVNNIIWGAVGDGITSWHGARQLIIANNLSTGNGGNGILIGSGQGGATSRGHSGTVVANNIVSHNMLYGIKESSDGEHPVGPGNRYLNNLMFFNNLDQRSSLDERMRDPVVSGNLSADPGLPAVAALPAMFTLPPDSPAVDAGTCVAAPRNDFDGDPRPQGRAVDIGPYELRSTAGRCDG